MGGKCQESLAQLIVAIKQPQMRLSNLFYFKKYSSMKPILIKRKRSGVIPDYVKQSVDGAQTEVESHFCVGHLYFYDNNSTSSSVCGRSNPI